MNVFDNFGLNAEKHVVCESSLIRSTISGHIYNVMIDHENEIDNGAIISLGEYVSPEYYKSVAYGGAGTAPILVLSVPRGYNSDRKSYQDECYFYNKKGEIARCYELTANDVFTVTSNAVTPLDAKAVKGNFVKVAAKGLYEEVADDPADGAFVGEILEVINRTYDTAYRIRVVRTGATV